jgi:uncharacterized protein (TIGR00645 family)
MIKFIEKVIFNAKWLLLPFYLVLILALGVYTYFDIYEFIEYIEKLGISNKDSAMLTFIELIDMTMIANLGKMIITGSYNSFVSKDHGQKNEHISSGTLKVKMATSLVGITSIGLLQRSVNITAASWDVLLKLAFVHGIFLVSSLILEVVDYFHERTELSEKEYEERLHNNKSH